MNQSPQLQLAHSDSARWHLQPTDSRGADERSTRRVERPRLVARLREAAGALLVVLTAPAGYGKTAVVAEWERSDDRRFIWLTLTEDDNDPERLVQRIGATLQSALSPRAGTGRRVSVACAPEERAPFVLVIDDIHAVDAPGPVGVLRRLIDRMPRRSQLVLAGRRLPASLEIGRLRAQRLITELGPRELAMTQEEALALLRGSGVALPRAAREHAVTASEGWPAALQLASLSFEQNVGRGSERPRFAGDDALMAAFVREEVLGSLDAVHREFLLHVAVIEPLTGPVCDAVLARRDSGSVLPDAADASLLLFPLDAAHSTYRWHPLLREMLLAELNRLDHAAVAPLHRRACTWYRQRGDEHRAVEHALAAGDRAVAAEIVAKNAAVYIAHGRNEAVRRTLALLPPDAVTERADLGLVATASHVAAGDTEAAKRLELETRARLAQQPAAEPHLAAAALLLRATLEPASASRLRSHAASAKRAASDEQSLRSVACLLEGVALRLSGGAGAVSCLEEGVRAAAIEAPAVQALCLAELALDAASRSEWELAAVSSSRAMARLQHERLREYPTAALVLATSALVRSHRGMLPEARDDLRAAAHALRALGEFVPWYDAEAHVAAARALMRTGDLAKARCHLTAAARAADRLAGAVALVAAIEVTERELASAVETLAESRLSLTKAEMRVLRLLPTHLSFREIAARLSVSANTVKTQAHAVYRKLDASSRSEAVQRAKRAGLLPAAA